MKPVTVVPVFVVALCLAATGCKDHGGAEPGPGAPAANAPTSATSANPYQLTLAGSVIMDLAPTGEEHCDALKRRLVALAQEAGDKYLRECSNQPAMSRGDCLGVMQGMNWSYQAKKTITDNLVESNCRP